MSLVLGFWRGTTFPQGLVIGELPLALAVTFAAQNAVLWARARRLVAFPAEGR